MGEELSDSDLMLRYKAGDISAFETLYRRHNDALYRYLLRHCGFRAAAEDVFQEAWSRIVRSRSRYQPTAQFKTFLYRVAYNCFIDHTRRNKRYAQSMDLDADCHQDPADPPDISTERLLARERLLEALADLPFEQRDAFLLHEEAGLSIDAIARVTGTNRETAKSRLRYAVNKLRVAIGEPAEKT